MLDKAVFIKVLKGAPMSVLLALWVHGSMNRQNLVLKTGFGRDTIGVALTFLEELGLIVRGHYRKWQVSDGFYQLPLPDLAEGRINRLSGGDVIEGVVVDNDSERRISRLSPSSSSSVIKKKEEEIEIEKKEEVLLVNNPDFDQAAYDFLVMRGVGRSFSLDLAGRDYVDENYVIDHLAAVDARDEPLRYALQRMKEGDRP